MVVAAFQAVGAIMSLALLVLPGATALLVARRMPMVFAVIVVHSAWSAVAGLWLASALNCNFGAAVVVSGAFAFALLAIVMKFRGR